MMKNPKKAALITGGAQRLGKAFCLALAEKGYDIALHYGHSKNEAEETARLIRQYNVQCELFQCDLADLDTVQQLIPDVFKKFPYCNLVINSASIFKRATFNDTDLDFLEKHLTVNFKTPFLLSHKFGQFCTSGLIVNLLDTKISKNSDQFFAYTLSKKLLFEFTMMSAKVLGPNIRVNGICPGIILPSTETSGDVLNQLIEKLPLRKKGHPKNIVQALMYLIENDFVTGDCLFVDGGEQL